MPHLRPSSANALCILGIGIGTVVLYGVFLKVTMRSAKMGESNLQSNLIRTSHYLRDTPAPVAIAGSSVAGRLLPDSFAKEGLLVQNLGLDGSRPLFAFEIIKRRPQLPKYLLVDTSTLFQPLMANDNILRAALDGEEWKIASFVSQMRPEHRPSSLLYTWFKLSKESRVSGQPHNPWKTSLGKADPAPSPVKQAWAPEDQYFAVKDQLVQLRSQGVRVALLNIPRSDGWALPTKGLDRRLADDLGIPIIEPGPVLAAQGANLTFSDGVHLDIKSAEKVSTEIAKELHKLKANDIGE